MTETPRLAPAYPVTTERLTLRPIDPERDAAAIHAYRSLPEVCRYVPFSPEPLEDLAARLREPSRHRSVLDAQAEGQVLFALIELRETGEVVGDLVLFWHSDADRHAEVGYVLHPDHAGRGYATEAVRALVGLAFDHAGAHRVTTQIDERNIASVRVVERLGFRQEARFEDAEWFKGEWTTMLVHALLDHEWAARGLEPSADCGWVEA